MEIYRETHPDLYARTEAIARIIDPAAFISGRTVLIPPESHGLWHARRKYQQAAAMRKAHEILEHLGVSTEVDWETILTRLAEDTA